MSPAETRPPRRMLPSVTDVVNELSRVVKEDPAVLFRVARQVVAEELGRVKQGFESASIEVLARRARRLLGPVSGESPAVVQASLFAAPEPPGPVPAPPVAPEPAPAPDPEPPAAGGSPADEPFAVSSDLDLGWEKELPIQPDDAPFRSAILPIPKSRMPAGIAPLPDQAAPRLSAGPEPELPPPALPPSPPPAAPAAPEIPQAQEEPEPPLALDAGEPPEAPEAPETPAPEPAPVVPSAPPPVRSGPATAFPPPEVRPVPEPPLPAEELQEVHPPAGAGPETEEAGRITTQEWKSLGVPTGRLEAPPPATRPPAPVPRPPRMPSPGRTKPGRHGLIAVAAVLVVAAGLAYFFRDVLFVKPVARPEDPVSRTAHPKPATPAASPAQPSPEAVSPVKPPEQKAVTRAVSAPPAPSPGLVRPAAASSVRTKGALIVSRDWAGRPAVWVVHFSSHKDRPGAEKEAARLGAALGKTGHAVEVDLGEKGIWYRVLVGDFATQEEARAYHDELQAKNTPNLGFVYQLKGEE